MTAMIQNILECGNIEKSFFGVPVLRDVNLVLKEGRILGLVGENGAGKSTLMNILGGVIPADSGAMTLAGNDYSPQNPAAAFRQGIAFIHQELNLFTNLSIAENLCIASFPKRRIAGVPLINRKTIRERAKALLKSVDLPVSPDTLIEDLSPGERQLVEIAKALGEDARIIIFDEPTTSLTARETERLFAIIQRLRSQGISMIYISHILGEVLRLCDDVMVLRDGAVVGAGARDQFTLERLIALMVGRNIDQLYPPRSAPPSTEAVFEVKGLSQPGIVRNISFVLHAGEILGISGLMGAGRTELVRILFGLDPFERGQILVRGVPLQSRSPRQSIRRGMAFLTEDRREEGLLMDATIADNIALVALPPFGSTPLRIVNESRRVQAVNQVAHLVRLQSGDIHRQLTKTLSGGNQQKVVLAKWLVDRPEVFILDEPTRGIDVGAKYEVYKIMDKLAAEGTAILFVSSEMEELIGMCDRILVMGNGEIQRCVARAEFDKEEILRAALRESAR